MGCPSRVRLYPHISAQSVNNPLIKLGCTAAICRIVPWNCAVKAIKEKADGVAVNKWGKIRC
jgi:hypothetical protein